MRATGGGLVYAPERLVSAPSPKLEDLVDLVDPRVPSAIARDDEELAAAGIPNSDLAATKNAFAAVGRAESPEPPSAELRARLLASAGRGGRYGRYSDRIARLFDLATLDAEALLARIEQPDAWKPFLVEGLEMIPVETGKSLAGAIATLVRIRPGARFPAHQHRGEEITLVLDGGFREPDGDPRAEFWRGDEIVRTDGTEHILEALPGTPCIAAVVIVGYADFR